MASNAEGVPFVPEAIVWFHAVNTTGVWSASREKMARALADQRDEGDHNDGAATVCFGIECDLRWWADGNDDSARLVLAHDPLPTDGSWRASALSFGDLVLQLAAFKREQHQARPNTSPPFTFVLKIDVKMLEALPALLGCLEFAKKKSSLVFGTEEGSLGLRPSQVWLNMDVVPLAPLGLCASVDSSVAVAVAVPFFQQAVSELGLGLSLGWQIDPRMREWAARADTEALKQALDAAHSKMMSFVEAVFAPDTNTKEAKTGDPCSSVVTFALNFLLFLGNPTALGAFRELCDATADAVVRSGRPPPFVFPTFWRARTDTISDATRRRLVDDCHSIANRRCSVDQE